MAKLGLNWVTEKNTDFEYKKYILLAYLKEVHEEFGSNRLYPHFSELISHYRSLQSFVKNKTFLAEQFPQQLEKIDAEKLRLEYNSILEDDELMQEIMTIIDFSLPKFEAYLEEGKQIFDFIEQHLHLSPVGLIPLRNDFGYLFIQNGSDPQVKVYQYETTLFEGPDEKYRGLQTRFVTTFTKSLANPFETMKRELLRRDIFSSHPATFAIEADMTFPYNESLLPIARRLFIRHLAAA